MNGTTSNFVPGYFPEITGNSSVLAGSTVQLSNPQTGGTWSSSSGAIATVNSSGLVTGVSAGTVTITYSYCGQSTSYSVTVNSAAALTVISTGITSFSSCLGFVSPAQSITVSGANLTANVTVTAPTGYEVSTSVASGYASSITITASGTLNATTVYIRLSSSASVGSVNGTLTITSTDATTQSVSLTGAVTAAPSAGTLSGTQAICVGNTTTYTSSVNGGAWTSSNTAVATVNASGVITGVTAGTATITYTVTGTDGCADATATRSVTVSALPPISITQTNPSVCQGGDIILEAVSSAASQIYGSGFGTNPNISAAVDQNWEVVALPQTFYNSATFSAMNVTLPYSAKVISGADLPSIFAYRNGFNDGSNTYYWIAPYANATSLQGGSYNWIVRQEFQVSSSGTYNFSFTGAGDNDISFFLCGNFV